MNTRFLLWGLLVAVCLPSCSEKDKSGEGDRLSSRDSTSTRAARPRKNDAPRELTLDLGNGVTMELALIPPGTFLMGSAADVFNNEEPMHQVKLSKPFYMGLTPVTVAQFSAFAKASGHTTGAEKAGSSMGIETRDGKLRLKAVAGVSWRNPSFDQGGNHPVVQVSWNDAKAFCHWLSQKSGKGVRLPTEAEWEYACRAGTRSEWPWGEESETGKGRANCGDRSLKKRCPRDQGRGGFFDWEDGFVCTSPVAAFRPNAFGLYDMIGNVWEWCEDFYGRYGGDAIRDPAGPDNGTLRVSRGGSWSRGPMDCRSARRVEVPPNVRSVDIGFRVVVTADVN